MEQLFPALNRAGASHDYHVITTAE